MFSRFSETADKTSSSSLGVRIDSYGSPLRGHIDVDDDLRDFNVLPPNTRDIMKFPTSVPLTTGSIATGGGVAFPIVHNSSTTTIEDTATKWAMNYAPNFDYALRQPPAGKRSIWAGYHFAPLQLEFPDALQGDYEVTVILEGDWDPKHGDVNASIEDAASHNGIHGSDYVPNPNDIAYTMDFNSWAVWPEFDVQATDQGDLSATLGEETAYADPQTSSSQPHVAFDNTPVPGNTPRGAVHLHPITTGNISVNYDILGCQATQPDDPGGTGVVSHRRDLQMGCYRFDWTKKRLTYTCHVHVAKATTAQGKNRVLLKIPVVPAIAATMYPVASNMNYVINAMRTACKLYSTVVSVKEYNTHGNLGMNSVDIMSADGLTVRKKYRPSPVAEQWL